MGRQIAGLNRGSNSPQQSDSFYNAVRAHALSCPQQPFSLTKKRKIFFFQMNHFHQLSSCSLLSLFMGVGEQLLTLRGPIWPPRCYCWKAAGQFACVNDSLSRRRASERPGTLSVGGSLTLVRLPLRVQISLHIIQITIWTAERRKPCVKSALSLTNLRWHEETKSCLSCLLGPFLQKGWRVTWSAKGRGWLVFYSLISMNNFWLGLNRWSTEETERDQAGF